MTGTLVSHHDEVKLCQISTGFDSLPAGYPKAIQLSRLSPSGLHPTRGKSADRLWEMLRSPVSSFNRISHTPAQSRCVLKIGSWGEMPVW
mmetsp:Transcript_18826/g.42459  ORF Transcript_18826/g.42459 Transcript_18826/m.42459 type:complete len:90 (-) Transcript_18826:676-945(-)